MNTQLQLISGHLLFKGLTPGLFLPVVAFQGGDLILHLTIARNSTNLQYIAIVKTAKLSTKINNTIPIFTSQEVNCFSHLQLAGKDVPCISVYIFLDSIYVRYLSKHHFYKIFAKCPQISLITLISLAGSTSYANLAYAQDHIYRLAAT